MKAMIGGTISNYEIIGKLGEGGMGVVYKAHDTRLERIVALKFLPAHLSASDKDKARLVLEAKSASSLNHPNVCTIYDIQEFDDETFIVMEYVEGKTLREAKQGMTVAQAVDVSAQIAEGLAAAHEKAIIHRDIKADNIMIRPDGRVQIMDFGLAKLQGVSSLTKEGSTIGTTGYMSPEQVQGLEADHRADIFALGVVMYELLTGELPFRGNHEAAVMYEIVNAEPPPIHASKPGVEPDLERIVMKCLEKDRADRYQSAREIAVDLRRFKRDTEGSRVRPTSASTPLVVRRKKSLWLRVALPGAFLLATLVVAIMSLRSRGDALDSLAVLPFDNEGGDPNMEYLSDGITESLINSFTKIPNLRVIPRSTVFRFKGKDHDPQDVGTKLNVRAVLTGRITRRGDDLHVQVDLIDIASQSQLWGEHYNRGTSELLSLQDEITNDVSGRLRLGVDADVRKNVTKRSTENPEAYKLYLQGRFSWNKRKASEIQKAIGYFNEAIALDPAYSLAYVGLAESYVIQEQYAGLPGKEVYPKAIAAATRALAIDNTIAEAYTTLAFADFVSWNWEKAEKEFTMALSLNPRYATSYHWYAIFLHTLGRHDEASRAIGRAKDLDPLSPVIGLNVAIEYEFAGKFEQAIQGMDAVLALDSTFGVAHYRKVQPYLKLGKVKEAYEAAVKGVQAAGRSAESLSFLGIALGRLGRKDEALKVAEELEQRFAARSCPGYYIARVYIGLGAPDRVFAWIEKDFANHSGSMIWLTQDNEWDEYRSDPRYIDILKRIGLKK